MTSVESAARQHLAGSSVLALRGFLDERLGGHGFDRVLQGLPPHLSEPIAGILLPVNWYPTESYLAVVHAAVPLVGPSLYDDLGEFAADYEITTFQRFLLRFTSPAAFVEHTGRLWPRFHNSGSWTVESTGKQQIRGTLRDFAIVDPGFCRVMAAWVRRAGRISAPRFEVRHSECRARGAEACVFTGAW